MGRGKSPIGKNKGGNAKSVYTEGSPGEYQKQADELLKGVYDVLDDFGMHDALKGIYYSQRSDDAAMDGAGNLKINVNYLKDGNDQSDQFVSNTFYGTGAHEAGHTVIRGLLEEVMPGASRLEISTARNKGKLETEVLREAQRRYGSNPRISQYGSSSYVEKVAEAVSDVYSNGNRANPYSNTIVGVLKDINAGKFVPTIKVTRREMGL